MSDAGTAEFFKHGSCQAVRLPKEFHMPGTEVRVRRIERGVLVEPIDAPFDVTAWVRQAERISRRTFHGRRAAAAPVPGPRKIFDE
jgi:antitoxin VapB